MLRTSLEAINLEKHKVKPIGNLSQAIIFLVTTWEPGLRKTAEIHSAR